MGSSAFKAWMMAVAAACALAGCVIVISDEGIQTDGEGLHFRSGAGSADGQLADRVRSSMLADPLLKDADLSVGARDGVVTLKGAVVDLAQFDRAIELARKTPGVDKVVSRLQVEVR